MPLSPALGAWEAVEELQEEAGVELKAEKVVWEVQEVQEEREVLVVLLASATRSSGCGKHTGTGTRNVTNAVTSAQAAPAMM